MGVQFAINAVIISLVGLINVASWIWDGNGQNSHRRVLKEIVVREFLKGWIELYAIWIGDLNSGRLLEEFYLGCFLTTTLLQFV